eukprot:jgi/Mesvir1/19186/Mv11508-RA.1
MDRIGEYERQRQAAEKTRDVPKTYAPPKFAAAPALSYEKLSAGSHRSRPDYSNPSPKPDVSAGAPSKKVHTSSKPQWLETSWSLALGGNAPESRQQSVAKDTYQAPGPSARPARSTKPNNSTARLLSESTTSDFRTSKSLDFAQSAKALQDGTAQRQPPVKQAPSQVSFVGDQGQGTEDWATVSHVPPQRMTRWAGREAPVTSAPVVPAGSPATKPPGYNIITGGQMLPKGSYENYTPGASVARKQNVLFKECN